MTVDLEAPEKANRVRAEVLAEMRETERQEKAEQRAQEEAENRRQAGGGVAARDDASRRLPGFSLGSASDKASVRPEEARLECDEEPGGAGRDALPAADRVPSPPGWKVAGKRRR